MTNLQEAYNRFCDQDKILALANDFIIVRDMDDKIVYWNLGAMAGYGWPAEQALGQVARHLLQTKSAESAEQIMGKLLRQGHWEGELQHCRSDGSIIVVNSSQTLNRDVAGSPLSILEINHDITQQKITQDALRWSEEELRQLNAELESKVIERTWELHKSNAILETENIERQAAETALQQLNDELENRVFERTRDLREMNAKLEQEINERQIVEEALLESENRLKSILSAMPDVILLFDKDTRLIDDRWRQDIFSYVPFATASKKSLSELLPPEIAARYENAIRQVLTSGSTPVVEFRLPINGFLRTRETRFVKCGSEEVLAVVRDTTEQKHDEAGEVLFREMTTKVISEEPIEAILTYACEQLVKEYRFSYCGLRWKEPDGSIRYGAAAGKLVGRITKEAGFLPRWDKPYDIWLAADVIRSGKSKVIGDGEFSSAIARKRAHRYKILAAAIFPIIVKGDTIGVFQILSERPDEFNDEKLVQRLGNFSEQIAIAVAMAKDRQRLKLLTTGLENTSNSIIIADREGLIRWVNPAFENLYGYKTRETLGKNAVELVSVNQDTNFNKRIRSAIINKREWSGTLVTCRRDGAEVISEATVTPILDELGQIENFLIVSHDITERIKAQQSTLAATEARARAEKLASIGTMAAGISHEINQPLNSIKIISSGSLLLLEQGKEISAAECAESWTEISNQIDAISNIISHLRSVIRHDETRFEACNINVAIEASLGLVGKQIASHGITIEKMLQENLPLISAVSTGLEEVVVNLLVNAMQALDSVKKADKQIVIRTCLDRGVRLEIRDNGPGINPALVQKIFEPFFSTKSGGSNLGLGLAIANSIVTSYNGTIEAASDGFSGTTIRIAFPTMD